MKDSNRQIDDFYPTPPEATEALLNRCEFNKDIWEPACGNGAISNVLIRKGHNVTSTDLNDFGFGKSFDSIDKVLEHGFTRQVGENFGGVAPHPCALSGS